MRKQVILLCLIIISFWAKAELIAFKVFDKKIRIPEEWLAEDRIFGPLIKNKTLFLVKGSDLYNRFWGILSAPKYYTKIPDKYLSRIKEIEKYDPCNRDIIRIVDFFNRISSLGECDGAVEPIFSGELKNIFNFGRIVGEGSFGSVRLVESLDGSFYALKTLEKEKIVRSKQAEHTKGEKEILWDMGWHPFIVTLVQTFSDKYHLHLLLEYLSGGELHHYVKKARGFKEDVARFYLAEIILAIEALHVNGIIYRDLKPENIVLDHEGHVRIVDFGLSKKLPVGIKKTATFCGTAEYVAPEIIAGKGYGKEVDLWTLGVLVYELLSGFSPFYAEKQLAIYRKILKGEYLLSSSLFSDEAQDLIMNLLNSNPSERLSIEAIKKHPFFFGKVDWRALYLKKVIPPIIPRVKSSGSTEHFDKYKEKKDFMDTVGEQGDDGYGDLFEGF